jgi:hypothetical protein
MVRLMAVTLSEAERAIIPAVVLDAHELQLARYLEDNNLVECDEAPGATVWQGAIRKAFGKSHYVEWRFKHWTKPA